MTKEQVLEQVWQADIVRDGTLRFGFHRLRSALGDEGRDFIRTIKGSGYRFAAPVQEVFPARRDQDPAPARRRRVQAVAAACVLLLFAAAVITFLVRRGAGEAEHASRRSVAVLEFHNLSGREDAAWISTALSEMLAVELAAGGRLRTIPGESVSLARTDLELSPKESFAPDTLRSIRQRLGADLVLMGSYLSLECQAAALRVDLRVQDADSGDTIVVLSQTRTLLELAGLVSSLGAELRVQLDAGSVTTSDSDGIAAAFPSSVDVARLYSAGLARLRHFDALGARVLLEEAVRAEPEYPLAHSALSLAWSHLGYDARAVEEATLAQSLSSDLSWAQRQEVQARYHETLREWNKAVAVHQALWTAYPDNPEYAFALARAQLATDQPRRTLEMIEGWKKIASSPSEKARVDLMEARAYQALSEYRRGEELATRAGDGAQQAGARLLEARSLLIRGECARRLGDRERALESLERARSAYTSAGDRSGEIQALGLIAAVHGNSGDHEAAAEILRRAVSLAEEIGWRRGRAQLLGNLAAESTACGRLVEAEKYFVEARREYREVGSAHGAALVLANSAALQGRQGRFEESESRFDEALESFRQIGATDLISLTLANLAATRMEIGKLELARENAAEALSIDREARQSRRIGRSLLLSCELMTSQGQVLGALELYEDTVAEVAEYGSARSVVAAHLAGSIVFLARGEMARAEQLAGKALEAAREFSDQVTIADSEMQAARVARDEGRNERALELGHQALAFEARLALLSIEATDQRDGVRSRLEKLAADAEERGYGLVASRARGLLAPL